MRRRVEIYGAVLIWAGGGGGVWADQAKGEPSAGAKAPPAGSVAASPGQEGEERASDQPAPVLEIVSGLQWESVVYQMEIRNAGNHPVDMSKCRPRTGAASGASKGGLTLLRGSFELCAGDRALIITHAGVDPNDVYRATFANVYTWIKGGPDALTLAGGGVTLIGDRGVVLGDPGPMFVDKGTCCTTNVGQNCVTSCGCSASVLCVEDVGEFVCCTTMNACCWKSGEHACPGFSGCPPDSPCCD